jgi:MFS superfamily sulfate permease-like transporter
MLLGIIILILTNSIVMTDIKFSLPQFSILIPDLVSFFIGMITAGIAQLFLTLTNVMIATVLLIKDLFPEREIDSNTLAINMGAMNLFSPFLGGIPLCHGSGGLAAQYAFGARSGGSMILEGILEIFLGIFFAETLLTIFSNFPISILGSMLLYTAFLLGKISVRDISIKKNLNNYSISVNLFFL